MIRIASFLDDGLGVPSLYKMTLFHSNFVKKSLQNAGFVINEENSDSVRSNNKLKKRFLTYTNRKTVKKL